MNILDSSAWIELFINSKNAKNFIPITKRKEQIIVPSIVLYEVFKRLLTKFKRRIAHKYIATMRSCLVIDLNDQIALHAASLGKELKLAMADSIILATAEKYGATIWTTDVDFKNIKGVKYFKKG